jgi:osmoprotectant transport system ATP-binding protein
MPGPPVLPVNWLRMPATVEFRDVQVTTPQGRALLQEISLAVEEGTTTVLLGRSGSGKTTLLRTVNRMVESSSGEVLVHGQPNRSANLIELRRGIGYVIQETGLFPHFRVERDVALVLEAQDRPRAECIRRSHEWLAAVGLDPAVFARRYPHQLSGGQRQRVGLARALAADPAILLMDEPFGALDPLTRAEMQDMLRALLARLRKTVLLVTHDLDEALFLGDQIALLDAGKLVARLPPQEFLRSGEPVIQAYIRAFHRGERREEARA